VRSYCLASNNWQTTALAHPGMLTDTRRMRELILAHRGQYLALVNWNPPTITSFQQIAIYEGQKMSTAYLNISRLQFEKQFRRMMEFLLHLTTCFEYLQSRLGQRLSDLHIQDILKPAVNEFVPLVTLKIHIL
jgi:hypothetical protein